MQKITRILQTLLAHGYKQAEISKNTAIPQSRLSRWTNGIGIPQACDDALALAEWEPKALRAKSKKHSKLR